MKRWLWILALSLTALDAQGRWTIHVGPPSVGNGGPNPLSIPPINPLDYGVIYVTRGDSEWSFSISPGFFYGKRHWLGDAYVSGGFGFGINANGIGPGVYTAIGYDACGPTVCFNADYRQALTVTALGLNSAYAARLGVTFGL